MAHGPSVSIEDIEHRIVYEHAFNLGAALEALGHPTTPQQHLVTICAVTHANGYTAIGVSACAAAENYKKDVGERFARQKAIEQFWPAMGYALREMIHQRALREGALGD